MNEKPVLVVLRFLIFLFLTGIVSELFDVSSMHGLFGVVAFILVFVYMIISD